MRAIKNHSLKPLARAGIGLLMTLGGVESASALDQYWGGGSANFSNTGSWFTGPNGIVSGAGAVPGSFDNAIFDYNFATDPYSVTFSQNRNLNAVVVGGNDVSFTQNNFKLSLSALSSVDPLTGSLRLGTQANENGSLSLFNGTIETSGAVMVGGSTGTNMTLSVDSGGLLDTDFNGTASELRIGVNGTGLLEAKNGGRILGGKLRLGINAGGVGTLSVDGTAGNGSRVDVVGDAIFGELGTGYGVLSNGAILTTSGRSSIGADFASGTTSLVTLQTGSLWAGNAFDVGGLSSGQLSLSGGSVVSGSSFTIAGGQQSGVTGKIELLGSSLLTATQDMSVGKTGGIGTFDIKTGSDADIDGDLRIGDTKVGNGAVLVNGTGSTLDVTNKISVGLQGTGQMTVSGGGVVSSAVGTIGALFNSDTGLPSNGTATVTGAGSIWNNSGLFYVGEEGNGTLNITSGGAVNNTSGSVIIGRTLGSEGTVSLSGSGLNQPGASLNAAGQTVTVGRGGVGTLNITGTGLDDAFNPNPVRLIAQNVVVGDLFLSQGELNVTNGQGAGENVGRNLQIANRLTVGKGGTGVMDLAGSYTSITEVIVGEGSTGHGTVTLDGSLLEVGGAFVIGDAGTGVVNLGVNGDASGTLYLTRVDQFVVGRQAGSIGTLNVGKGYVGPWNGSASVSQLPVPIFGDAGAANINLTGSGEYNAQDVVLNTDGAILANQSGSVANVLIQGNATQNNWVTWDINSPFDGDYGETIIGKAGSATLNIGAYAIVQAREVQDGPGGNWLESRQFVLGDDAGSSGIVNVGGSMTGLGSTFVGDGGFGQINLTQTGSLNMDRIVVGNGSRGEIHANHGGSLDTYQVTSFFEFVAGVGTGGDAEISLTNGSGLWSGEIILGRDGGQADLSVSGPFSQVLAAYGNTGWNGNTVLSGNFTLGESGAASLVVEDGGAAMVEGSFLLGRYALGEDGATARGSGSALIGPDGSLDVAGSTVVGWGGTGGLTLQGAATLGTVDVGLASSSLGNLVINTGNGVTSTAVRVGVAGNGTALLDESSSWDATSVAVGVTGTGLLSVAGGSEFDASSSLDVGLNAGSVGTLRVAGANSKARIVNDISLGQAGAGTLEVKTGGLVTATNLLAADLAGSTAELLVQGLNSRMTLGGNLLLGQAGVATATVETGGLLSLNHLTLGAESTGSGTLTVQDTGSRLVVTGAVVVGDEGNGTLRLLDGQSLAPTSVAIAQGLGSRGVLELENGSVIQTDLFDVGQRGVGTFTLGSGSEVEASFLFVGSESTGTGTMTLSGADTLATVSSVLVVGSQGEGNLNIGTGAAVATNGLVIGSAAGSLGAATVGIGSHVTAQSTTVGASGVGTLTLALGDLTTGSLIVGNFAGSDGTLTLSTGADLTVTGTTAVLGKSGSALVMQSGGAQFFAGNMVLGEMAGSDVYATLDGNDTVMRADGDFYAGQGGQADFSVFGGALLETGTPTLDFSPATTVAVIGEGVGSAGSRVTVQGLNSRWVHHGGLSVGPNPAAGVELRVFSGAELDVDGLLDIGSSGLLTLNDGRVEVRDFVVSASNMEGVDWVKGEFFFKEDKTLDDDVDIYLLQGDGIHSGRTLGAGGNFHFGTEITLNGGVLDAETLTNAAALDFDSGTLRLTYAQIGLGELFDGLLVYDTAFAANHTLDFQNTTINDSALVIVGDRATLRPGQVTNRGEIALDGGAARLISNGITNDGLITGTGRVLSDVQNSSSGEVRADVGDRLVLQGLYHNNQGVFVVEGGRMDIFGSVFNSGQINVVDGSLTTNDYVYNSGSLSVTNGTARFDGQLSNSGVIQVSGTHADFFGTVDIQSSGSLLIGATAQATFYDSVTNNGEVVVGANAAFVSLGTLNGSGSYSGVGSVEILGDFNPGNSPGIVEFDVDTILGPSSTLTMELGGLTPGTGYDQLIAYQDITLNGNLVLTLYGSFVLSDGMQFTLVQAEQSLFGQFIGLDEGALVGNLSGHDVFITYSGGDGNDVVAFTNPVPEPGTIGLLVLAGVGLWMYQRRQTRRKQESAL